MSFYRMEVTMTTTEVKVPNGKLVLRRKAGETITIGQDVVLTIEKVSGNRVSVSIQAPREMKVLRGELAPAA